MEIELSSCRYRSILTEMQHAFIVVEATYYYCVSTKTHAVCLCVHRQLLWRRSSCFISGTAVSSACDVVMRPELPCRRHWSMYHYTRTTFLTAMFPLTHN